MHYCLVAGYPATKLQTSQKKTAFPWLAIVAELSSQHFHFFHLYHANAKCLFENSSYNRKNISIKFYAIDIFVVIACHKSTLQQITNLLQERRV